MKKMRNILLLVIITVATTGCYYDVEEELYPNNNACDIISVTFSATVSNILQNYGCNGCHGSVAPSGNINLIGYNNVKIQVNNGKLFGSINHSSGFSPMPKGGSKMNTCDIAKVKAWIDAGAPNN